MDAWNLGITMHGCMEFMENDGWMRDSWKMMHGINAKYSASPPGWPFPWDMG